MRSICTCLTFLLFLTGLNAQTVTHERTAELVEGNYEITGSATLQQFDDGSITLSLSEDFDTPQGPDVRIFLNDSPVAAFGTELVNLSAMNHFSGALTIEVPDGLNLEDNDYVVFHCLAFNQLWATGQFGAITTPGGGFTCLPHSVNEAFGADSVAVCPGDGEADLIDFANDIDEAAGSHFAYLITDENDILETLVVSNFFDFEATSGATQRVYGMHYDGEIVAVIGAGRQQTMATGCSTQSSNFLTVTKDGCAGFDCVESLTATHQWVTNVDVCATDGLPDSVLYQNNINTPAGEHYAFLLTDTNEVLLEVLMDSIYDFEGRGGAPLRIYGMSYAGDLQPTVGSNRLNTTATDCYVHSGGNLFLTVNTTGSCAVSGINEQLTAATRLYPNPTQGLLTVELAPDFEPARILLTNLLGQPVKQFAGGTQGPVSLDLGDLAHGVYLLRLESEAGLVVKRVVLD